MPPHTMYIDFEALGRFFARGRVLHIWHFPGSLQKKIHKTLSVCPRIELLPERHLYMLL